jgi:adenylate cyclase
VALAAVTSAMLIIKANWAPGLVTTSAVWSLVTLAELGRRQSYEFMQRLRLRTTMGLYFSPRIMEHVLKNPGSMEPQQAELTLLLTDLRNSTAIAETMGPGGTFTLLNQVFEAQTRAIMAEDGSMEHFLGDQFLSYWGAPDPQPDATDRAFRAALALIAGMEELRPKLDPKVTALFGYGVALHSGTALIGNKGSAQRLDYGLVGDLINSAARVESLTKYYGVLFLITREAYTKLSEPPPARLVDKVVVKGKTLPLELLEVRHPFSPANFEGIARLYDLAFADYERGNFTEAERKFASLNQEGQDKPSALMAERCRELMGDLPKNWNGIYELKTK